MNKPNNSRSIPVEIRVLIHKSFDVPLTDSEVAQLEHSLKSNPDAQQLYCELSLLGADLLAREQAKAFCMESHLEYRTEKTHIPARFEGIGRGSFDFVRSLPRAAAAMLALGLGLGCGVGILAAVIVRAPRQFFSSPWEWSVPDEVIAKIESTHEVVLQDSEGPESPPTRGLRAGQQIRIERGLLQIAHRNGVSVLLEGPAVYEIRSGQGGKLFTGRLSAGVPSDCFAFHLETPLGRLDVGPGRFGIDAHNSASEREVSVAVIMGNDKGSTAAKFVNDSGESLELLEGELIRIDSLGVMTKEQVREQTSFAEHIPPPRQEKFMGKEIFLGNLFDDSLTVSLTEAMSSDGFQAAAETIDLGIAAVHDGGLDVDVRLAEDGLCFNFANVGGGGPKILGLPSNDTYRSTLGIPIRTTGANLPYHRVGDRALREPTTKIEEGIGIHANELLTFDLNELRLAGGLENQEMRFVSDRAGINDREYPLESSRKSASANLIVVVSNERHVFSAYLNGKAANVVQHANVFSLDVDQARASRGVRYDGGFVRFEVPIPADARYLSLVATDLGSTLHDHTVFSGARLEVLTRSADSSSVEKSLE